MPSPPSPRARMPQTLRTLRAPRAEPPTPPHPPSHPPPHPPPHPLMRTVLAGAPTSPVTMLAAPVTLTPAEVDVVTAYLARYAAPRSRETLLYSLRVCATLLTGRPQVDPREVPWAQLGYAHVAALRARLAAEYAPASVNRHLLAVRGVLRECRRQKLITSDQLGDLLAVEHLRAKRPPPGRALTGAEVQRLFAAARAPPVTPLQAARDTTLLALAVLCGLRRAELADLNVGDWTRETGALRVRGKGGKVREVFPPKACATALDTWLAWRQHFTRPSSAADAPGLHVAEPLLVALHRSGRPTRARLSHSGITQLLAALSAKAKLPRFTPHDLRRTAVTLLFELGADALVIAKLVGHESVETTLRYDRRGDGAKKKAMGLLDSLFTGDEAPFQVASGATTGAVTGEVTRGET